MVGSDDFDMVDGKMKQSTILKKYVFSLSHFIFKNFL